MDPENFGPTPGVIPLWLLVAKQGSGHCPIYTFSGGTMQKRTFAAALRSIHHRHRRDVTASLCCSDFCYSPCHARSESGIKTAFVSVGPAGY